MADPNFLAGTAFLSIDGVRQRLAGEFSWMASTVTREALLGMDGFHGFKQKPAAGQIKAKLRDGQGVDVAALSRNTGQTITIELANGKVVTAVSCFTTEIPTVDAEEGTIDVTWQSGSVTES